MKVQVTMTRSEVEEAIKAYLYQSGIVQPFSSTIKTVELLEMFNEIDYKILISTEGA